MNDLSVSFKREQTEGRWRVTVGPIRGASVSVALNMKQVIDIGRLV